MRHRTTLVAVLVPASLGCLCNPGAGTLSQDTAVGTLDTSIAACVPSDTPTLALGAGASAFEPMPETLEILEGPQGGQHVFLALESTGLDLSARSILTLSAYKDDALLLDAISEAAWTCGDESGVAQILGILFALPDDAVGQEIRLQAEVVDPEGREATTSRTVQIAR